jgi:hypothetical protein
MGTLAGEMTGNGCPDLTCAADYDFHEPVQIIGSSSVLTQMALQAKHARLHCTATNKPSYYVSSSDCGGWSCLLLGYS